MDISASTNRSVLLNNLEDDVPRLLNTSLGADDLDRLALALGARDLDLGPGLLADAVDLGAAGADDVAVRARVRQDEVADGVLLGGLLQGAVELGAGGGDGFRRGACKNPGDVSLLGRIVQGVGLEGVGVGAGGGVVGNQRHIAAAARSGSRLAGRRLLAGVVDTDLMIGAQAAEELAVVCDHVVVLERDLDGLTLDFLGKLLDVSLGLLDVLWLARDLDLRAGSAGLALAGNVDGDTELLLHLAAGVTATADEQTVLVGLDLEDLGSLGLLIGNEGQDGSSKLLNNRAGALKANSVALSVSLGESSHTSASAAIGRTASFLDQRSEVSTCVIVSSDSSMCMR